MIRKKREYFMCMKFHERNASNQGRGVSKYLAAFQN